MLKKFLESRVFRYFIAAGVATIVDVGVYFLCCNYVFTKNDLAIGYFLLTAPTASLMISYSCGLITNFSISKFLVFKESNLETHKQFGRFVIVALFILCLNWLFMRVLIRQWHWFPTIARATSALSIGVLSFVFHKFFSFKVRKVED